MGLAGNKSEMAISFFRTYTARSTNFRAFRLTLCGPVAQGIRSELIIVENSRGLPARLGGFDPAVVRARCLAFFRNTIRGAIA